jgi:hypothetical protein
VNIAVLRRTFLHCAQPVPPPSPWEGPTVPGLCPECAQPRRVMFGTEATGSRLGG